MLRNQRDTLTLIKWKILKSLKILSKYISKCMSSNFLSFNHINNLTSLFEKKENNWLFNQYSKSNENLYIHSKKCLWAMFSKKANVLMTM